MNSRDDNMVEIPLPGESNPTPMTNFAGFRTLVTLSLRKSKIARGFADRALEVCGGVLLGLSGPIWAYLGLSRPI